MAEGTVAQGDLPIKMSVSMIEILEVTFAGVAFALALLAYYLLYQQGKKDKPNANFLKSIRLFMFLVFGLGVLAIGAQFLSSVLSPPSPSDITNKVSRFDKRLDEIDARLTREAEASNPAMALKIGPAKEPALLVGGANHAVKCPEGFVLTGISDAGRAGGDYAGNAIVRINFICSKLELRPGN